MKLKEIKELYKNLVFSDIKDKGLIFLRSTFLEKIHKSSIVKIPDSWKKIYFKLYPRLPQIGLEKMDFKKDKLFSIIKKRRSKREFSDKGLSLKTINKLLYFSSGINNFNKIKKDFDNSLRMYPSAGARYPLELYPVIFRSKDIPLGVYHYNVEWNTLELLLNGDFKKEFSQKITNQKWIEKSGMVIVITAVFARTVIKYKERGWRYIFFEAGHISQNLHLISTSLGLKCCVVGGFIDEEIIKILDLSAATELPLYLVVVGT